MSLQHLLNQLHRQDSSSSVVSMLQLSDKPPEVCAEILAQTIISIDDDLDKLLPFAHQLAVGLKQNKSQAEAEALSEKYKQAIEQLQQGPLRDATVVGKVTGRAHPSAPRFEVVTAEGHRRFPRPIEGVDPESLIPGTTVFLDPDGNSIVDFTEALPPVGQQAKFLRFVAEEDLVEVQVRDQNLLLHAAEPVRRASLAGDVRRGDRVIFCPNRLFAFRIVPADDTREHRFIRHEAVPNVDIRRDIGRPHECLPWLLERTRLMIERPDVADRFDLRPRVGLLMVGPSGTGKTLTDSRAYLRGFHDMLIHRTGRNDVACRVIRVKTSDLLSSWFGETDKNIDDLFNDVIALAKKPERTATGEQVLLPVVLILEECEGLSRRRGEMDGGVYDRVIGQMLQRLDDPVDDLAKLPVITLATSNRPDMVDAAMFRRLAGGRVARFSRLDRTGLYAVLGKKIKHHYPFASNNGYSNEELRSALLDQVVSALFSPNQEDVLLELTLRDGTRIKKRRRDFLTGAIVEQSVSEAIDQLAFEAVRHDELSMGLDADGIIDALCRQIDGLADNVTAHNAWEYVDLPENGKVADAKRIHPPRRKSNRLMVTQ